MSAHAMPMAPAAENTDPAPRYRVYWFDLITLIQARSLRIDTQTRRFVRQAITIMLALRQPFRLQNEQGDFVEYRAAMVSPRHVRRCLDARDSDLTIIEVDIAHPMYGPLIGTLAGSAPVVLSEYRIEALLRLLRPGFGTAYSCSQAHELVAEVLSILVPARSQAATTWDPRVAQTIERVENWQGDMPAPAALADQALLSESRLRHLFKQQTACSLRAYVRWAALRRALAAIAQGSSMEEAARLTGFYDRAHLNRVINEHMVERISDIRTSATLELKSCR